MVGVPIASNFEVTFTEIHKSNETNALAFTGHPVIAEDSMMRGRATLKSRWLLDYLLSWMMTVDSEGTPISARGKQSATAVDQILLMRQHAV
jgi:hypothetical protein